jgi:hypothetical protein
LEDQIMGRRPLVSREERAGWFEQYERGAWDFAAVLAAARAAAPGVSTGKVRTWLREWKDTGRPSPAPKSQGPAGEAGSEALPAGKESGPEILQKMAVESAKMGAKFKAHGAGADTAKRLAAGVRALIAKPKARRPEAALAKQGRAPIEITPLGKLAERLRGQKFQALEALAAEGAVLISPDKNRTALLELRATAEELLELAAYVAKGIQAVLDVLPVSEGGGAVR